MARRIGKLGLNRYGEAIDTRRQLRLYAAANRLLRKAGAFEPKAELSEEDLVVDAESIGANGHLRPTWQASCRPYREKPEN